MLADPDRHDNGSPSRGIAVREDAGAVWCVYIQGDMVRGCRGEGVQEKAGVQSYLEAFP